MSETKYLKYSSPVNGFSINYPSKWEVQEDTGFFLVGFFPKTKHSIPTNIHIIVPDLSMFQEIPTPDQFIEISKQQIEQQGATNIKVTETRYGQYNGHAFTYSIPSNDGDIKFKQFLFIVESTVFVISYSSPDVFYDKFLSDYETVVPTLQIFKAKGFKQTHLEAKTYQLANQMRREQGDVEEDDENIYYQTWFPKNWNAIGSSATQQIYRNKEYELEYNVSVESVTNMEDRVKLQADFKTEYMETKAKEFLAKVTSLPYEITAVSVENNGHPLSGYQVVVANTNELSTHKYTQFNYFFYKGYVFHFTFKAPLADGKIFEPVFARILARIRMQDFSLESPRYDIFDNLTNRYTIAIPKSFSLCKAAGAPSIIFEDSSIGPFPVFVITYEALGKPVLLDEYLDLIVSFHQKGLEGNVKFHSKVDSHVDIYRATSCTMTGTDPELQMNCKILFKCAVVKRSKGFLLNLRLPTQIFEEYYNKNFYLFDSVNFY